MARISQTHYANQFLNPEIKGVLPAARNLALSRPAAYIATSDVFCAIVLQDPVMRHKLDRKFGITEERMRAALRKEYSDQSAADEIDEFDELSITPMLDRAFESAVIPQNGITPRELLRALLSDDGASELGHFLIQLGVKPDGFESMFGASYDERKIAQKLVAQLLIEEN